MGSTTVVTGALRTAAAVAGAALVAVIGAPVATASLPAAPVAAVSLAPTQVSAADQAALLALHTKARQEVGVSPLSWDSALAADAQAWANELVKGSQNRHGRADEPLSARAKDEGENLAQGSASFTLSELADGWYDEKADYERAGKPVIPDGTLFNAGHYTQMVWTSSTRLGCGKAVYPSGETSLACRYSPAGNWTGERPYGAGAAPRGSDETQGTANPGFALSGSLGASLRGGTVSTTAPITTPRGASVPTPTAGTTTTTTAPGNGVALLTSTCPMAFTPDLPSSERVATLRCLVNYYRSLKGLPVLASHVQADGFAAASAGPRLLPDSVRTGLLSALCTRSAGTVAVDRAQDAATPGDAMVAFGAKGDGLVRSSSGTFLGIGVSGDTYGIALVTCATGAVK